MKSVVAMGSAKLKVRGLTMRALALSFVLGVMVLWSCGCASYPGETVAEANRRHKRVLRTNTQMMMADIDMVLMLDRPSHLTDQRLP
ncbi:MAG: hypothetical protein JSW27_07715 [Phycisphaerales bacterium]|nr:MAG: hypothetical protein JSW27_07715 [Phycisphaerales bacterium]